MKYKEILTTIRRCCILKLISLLVIHLGDLASCYISYVNTEDKMDENLKEGAGLDNAIAAPDALKTSLQSIKVNFVALKSTAFNFL